MTNPPIPPPMRPRHKRYEYKTFTWRSDRRILERFLNDLGEQGWQVVESDKSGSGVVYLMMREKEEP